MGNSVFPVTAQRHVIVLINGTHELKVPEEITGSGLLRMTILNQEEDNTYDMDEVFHSADEFVGSNYLAVYRVDLGDMFKPNTVKALCQCLRGEVKVTGPVKPGSDFDQICKFFNYRVSSSPRSYPYGHPEIGWKVVSTLPRRPAIPEINQWSWIRDTPWLPYLETMATMNRMGKINPRLFYEPLRFNAEKVRLFYDYGTHNMGMVANDN